MRDELPGAQAGFYKIICFFTGINDYSDHSKSEHGEHKGGQEFPQYVPV